MLIFDKHSFAAINPLAFTFGQTQKVYLRIPSPFRFSPKLSVFLTSKFLLMTYCDDGHAYQNCTKIFPLDRMNGFGQFFKSLSVENGTVMVSQDHLNIPKNVFLQWGKIEILV